MDIDVKDKWALNLINQEITKVAENKIKLAKAGLLNDDVYFAQLTKHAENIGTSVNEGLSDQFKLRFNKVDWNKYIQLRNTSSHQYWSITPTGLKLTESLINSLKSDMKLISQEILKGQAQQEENKKDNGADNSLKL